MIISIFNEIRIGKIITNSGCSQQAGDPLSCVFMDNSNRRRLVKKDTSGTVTTLVASGKESKCVTG